jgi:hypothetical protein
LLSIFSISEKTGERFRAASVIAISLGSFPKTG